MYLAVVAEGKKVSWVRWEAGPQSQAVIVVNVCLLEEMCPNSVADYHVRQTVQFEFQYNLTSFPGDVLLRFTLLGCV